MPKLQTQGVHHITLIGADRQTSIDFWEGVLGMPFIFEQPNLDVPEESHLYFDPGDGRLITIFTREDRRPTGQPTPEVIGAANHVAILPVDGLCEVGSFAVERRVPGPRDVHIEIQFCGVCHSDLHQVRNEWGGSTFPMVPGHEILGRVKADGAEVTRFTAGQRVAVGCTVVCIPRTA